MRTGNVRHRMIADVPGLPRGDAQARERELEDASIGLSQALPLGDERDVQVGLEPEPPHFALLSVDPTVGDEPDSDTALTQRAQRGQGVVEGLAKLTIAVAKVLEQASFQGRVQPELTHEPAVDVAFVTMAMLIQLEQAPHELLCPDSAELGLERAMLRVTEVVHGRVAIEERAVEVEKDGLHHAGPPFHEDVGGR